MKAILTSSLGGISKVNGVRVPEPLPQRNGLLERLQSIWVENARVLVICADPTKYEKNDDVCACFRAALPMSGLSVSSVDMCDNRNQDAVNDLKNIDVLILTGGHVPTQNKFLKRLQLRERLSDYKGIIVAWSAGSINCADTVYAGPDLEGETLDPHYERWITGLGITDINIFPHLQSVKDSYLDGMRLVEDITFDDSVGHEIIALNDGSFVLIDDGRTTLYGEAYRIKDRRMTQICKDGQFVSL